MLFALLLFPLMNSITQSPTLDEEQVRSFAHLALDSIQREFPNKPGFVVRGPDDVQLPRKAHPVFYGSFDWHSSVHGHWMLIRLLKTHPKSSVATEIRQCLNQQLQAPALRKEADYFLHHDASFERMYGWAWLLQLAQELHTFPADKDAKQWQQNLAPLEDAIVGLLFDYLPKLQHPIRTGVHPDTAFAFSLALDYARSVQNQKLEKLLVEKSLAFYGKYTNYPSQYEPSGEDFFSSGLNEANLMRRVLPPTQYSHWLQGFFPGWEEGDLGPLAQPETVTDPTDGRLVHLAGLNLSRAWCFQGIADALSQDDPRRQLLRKAAQAHRQAGLRSVFSGHFEGEHWLASFAVYLLTQAGTTNTGH